MHLCNGRFLQAPCDRTRLPRFWWFITRMTALPRRKQRKHACPLADDLLGGEACRLSTFPEDLSSQHSSGLEWMELRSSGRSLPLSDVITFQMVVSALPPSKRCGVNKRTLGEHSVHSTPLTSFTAFITEHVDSGNIPALFNVPSS